MFWFDPELIKEEARRVTFSTIIGTKANPGLHKKEWLVLFLSKEGQSSFHHEYLPELLDDLLIDLIEAKSVLREEWKQAMHPLLAKRYAVILDFLEQEGYEIHRDPDPFESYIRSKPKYMSYHFHINNFMEPFRDSLLNSEHELDDLGFISIHATNKSNYFSEKIISQKPDLLDIYREGIAAHPKRLKEFNHKVEQLRSFRETWKAQHQDQYWRTVNNKRSMLWCPGENKNGWREFHIEAEQYGNKISGTVVNVTTRNIARSLTTEVVIIIQDPLGYLYPIVVGTHPYQVTYTEDESII